ncbi:hypothetical protein [Spirosoma endbachense]|uniref:Uncharacterized protein n=1 Tax=Spirosoma endbachense TaxID=2666025 RepID=A0A6P1VRJ5_9BACT|nr:hypothetical protein [Spirosoma endbachense]QHV95703.1 hypothetical protein GJR95_12090 [Spirosoma endbachense]
MTHKTKTAVLPPDNTPKPEAKSNLKAGKGIFKGKMVNKPSVWKEDLYPAK